MPKITIDIPEDISKTLRKYAIDNGRTYTQFLPRYITACVNNSIVTFDEHGEMNVSSAPNYNYNYSIPGTPSSPSVQLKQEQLEFQREKQKFREQKKLDEEARRKEDERKKKKEYNLKYMRQQSNDILGYDISVDRGLRLVRP